MLWGMTMSVTLCLGTKQSQNTTMSWSQYPRPSLISTEQRLTFLDLESLVSPSSCGAGLLFSPSVMHSPRPWAQSFVQDEHQPFYWPLRKFLKVPPQLIRITGRLKLTFQERKHFP